MSDVKKRINDFLLQRWGYKVVNTRKSKPTKRVESPLPERRLPSLDAAGVEALDIPGMTSTEAGKILYSLCVSQTVRGNVVEIGSWQGRSTSFLARACRDSRNGRLYAIDHFKGNRGKEASYVVGQSDLGDLREQFERNMERLGLREHVTLIAVESTVGVTQIEGPLRFVFIDGDHTREGVAKDVALVTPLLAENAVVAFDDFSLRFPGVVQTADEFLRAHPSARAFTSGNMLVALL